MNEINFRLLTKEEIEVRVGSVNKGGANLLLYMSSRAPMDILDDSVGQLGWQRVHARDNANCTVSIWNDEIKQWVSKEDTGVESNTEKEKGLASDSFKRSCVNWGIGRELYSAPDIFIAKDKLQAYSYENDKGKCYDRFVVTNIAYTEDRKISAVEIGVLEKYGKNIAYKEIFKNATAAKPASTTTATKATETAKAKPAPVKEAAPAPAPVPAKTSASVSAMIADDEVILLGNCRGKKYGEVKDSDTFKSFLNWVSKSSTVYTDEKVAEQFRKFKALAAS